MSALRRLSDDIVQTVLQTFYLPRRTEAAEVQFTFEKNIILLSWTIEIFRGLAKLLLLPDAKRVPYARRQDYG